MHIDWLPTIMGLATNGQWTGSLSGAEIDGIDVWNNVIGGSETSRTEIVFASKPDEYAGAYVAQLHGVKYVYNCNITGGGDPSVYFSDDLNSDLSYMTCKSPSLIADDSSFLSTIYSMLNFNEDSSSSDGHSIVMVLAVIAAALACLIVAIVSTSMKTLNMNISRRNIETNKQYFVSHSNREVEPLVMHK